MGILDPKFKYTPAAQTDIRRTFARYRREQRAQAETETRRQADEPRKVAAIGGRKK